MVMFFVVFFFFMEGYRCYTQQYSEFLLVLCLQITPGGAQMWKGDTSCDAGDQTRVRAYKTNALTHVLSLCANPGFWFNVHN